MRQLQVQAHIYKFLKLKNSTNQRGLQHHALVSALSVSQTQHMWIMNKLALLVINQNIISRRRSEKTRKKFHQKMQIVSLNLLIRKKLNNLDLVTMNLETQWKISLFIRYKEDIEVNLGLHKWDLNNHKMKNYQDPEIMIPNHTSNKNRLIQFLSHRHSEKILQIQTMSQHPESITSINTISKIEWSKKKKMIQI